MSKFVTDFNSISLKDKFTELYESIDRENQARIIASRFVNLASKLEAGNPTDSFFIDRIKLMEASAKDLKVYDWMPSIKKFINETNDFLSKNQISILLESVKFDLKLDRNSKFYEKAISKIEECADSENPVFSVVETLENETWIPLVKKLYEYCSKEKGNITGKNPNFSVSKIYSPVEILDENSYVFYAGNRLLKVNESELEFHNSIVSDDFNSLVRIVESSKISDNKIRLYPNTNSILEVEISESGNKLSLNGKVLESSALENTLLTGGFVRYGEIAKISLFEMAASKGSEIKEIDLGYSVKSSVFEGLSVNIFNLNDKIYVHKINKAMKENSLVEASSAQDAVEMVKSFMGYDISESLKDLLESERNEMERREREISKVKSRIKYIIEKLSQVESLESELGKSEKIDEAKAILQAELKEQNEILEGVSMPYNPSTAPLPSSGNTKLSSKSDLKAGKEYTVNGKTGYIFVGFSGGSYVFSHKNETDPTPIHMNNMEVEDSISKGIITECY
jgi:hypothetical protein